MTQEELETLVDQGDYYIAIEQLVDQVNILREQLSHVFDDDQLPEELTFKA